MRVFIIDPDAVRASLVVEGLAAVTPLEIRSADTFEGAEREIERFDPEVIVIACESPERDTLESLQQASDRRPRPVVMFVDRSAPDLTEAAVSAGVAAYVVDGLSPNRVRAVLDVAMSRFVVMQRLRADLKKAQADLASRKVIDKAKGLIMKERGVDENEAYGLLRSYSMTSGRPIGAVAADLVAFRGLLTGESS